MAVIQLVPRRTISLDGEERCLHEIASGELEDEHRYVRLLLRTMLEYSIDALCLVTLVDDEVVQLCSWRADDPDRWGQLVPLRCPYGRVVLGHLRRLAGVRRPMPSGTSRSITVAFRGKRQSVGVWSPHDGEVRLYRGAQRPPCPPYRVVYPYCVRG